MAGTVRRWAGRLHLGITYSQAYLRNEVCWLLPQEGDVLMDADGVKDRALAPERLAHMGAGDPLRLRVLCAETVDTGHSVLLFCGAKKVCALTLLMLLSEASQIYTSLHARYLAKTLNSDLHCMAGIDCQ